MLVKGSNDREYPRYKSHTLGLICDFFLYDTTRYLSEEGSDKLLFLQVAENQCLYYKFTSGHEKQKTVTT